MQKLTHGFYNRPTVQVAQDLLGKTLVFQGQQSIITETEAYVGQDDPACHAAKGITPRTKVMFGRAGVSYVYLIYGLYYCLNFVTEEEGFPAAVLIRGVLIKDKHLNGPGKVCRDLGVTKNHNEIDLVKSDEFFVMDTGTPVPDFKATPRIGIKVGTDKLWRFVVDKEGIRRLKV